MTDEGSTYGAADTVRAMLGRGDLTDDAITDAARKLGWPGTNPHPFLVAERLEGTTR